MKRTSICYLQIVNIRSVPMTAKNFVCIDRDGIAKIGGKEQNKGVVINYWGGGGGRVGIISKVRAQKF